MCAGVCTQREHHSVDAQSKLEVNRFSPCLLRARDSRVPTHKSLGGGALLVARTCAEPTSTAECTARLG